MTTEQKTVRQQKQDFQLHVALIQKIESCTKNKATFQAWLEGPEGLLQRLEPKKV